MNYDVDFFIAKFEAIPEEKWTTGGEGIEGRLGCFCAYGHCGLRVAGPGIYGIPECKALYGILDNCVAGINDGYVGDYPQPTPKQRILAALRDIKAKAVSA